jgi:hypothetical protein
MRGIHTAHFGFLMLSIFLAMVSVTSFFVWERLHGDTTDEFWITPLQHHHSRNLRATAAVRGGGSKVRYLFWKNDTTRRRNTAPLVQDIVRFLDRP